MFGLHEQLTQLQQLSSCFAATNEQTLLLSLLHIHSGTH
jgi:hypothetical protein